MESLLSAIFGDFDPFDPDAGIDLDRWVEDEDMFLQSDYHPSSILTESWSRFTDEILNQNRFFPQMNVDLEILKEASILSDIMLKNAYLFRARKSKEQKKIAPRNMGKPPSKLCGAGRANPQGIPYLYLADDEQTAIHEVRPNTTEFVTIGKFKILENIQILDLSNPRIRDPFKCGDGLSYTIQILPFLRLLGRELSKPIEPKNKNWHYIPTQYLCEYIKHQGYDGISYKSHLGPGKNIALFSEKKMKCTRSFLYTINAELKEVTN